MYLPLENSSAKIASRTSADEFDLEMGCKGWMVFEEVVEDGLVDRINVDLKHAYDICRAAQTSKGLATDTDGALHHLLGMGSAFLEFLEREYLSAFIKRFIGDKYILNSYGGSVCRRDVNSYLHNIHRDVRSYTQDINLMINMLVMLDDFTIENGATYFLSGSHHFPKRPADEYFFSHASRGIGRRGSVILFDSRLWHCAGRSQVDPERRALTLTFTRPFMKPQMDYPRLLGYDNATAFTSGIAQVLGFNARVPSTLDEWYSTPENRFYKADQE